MAMRMRSSQHYTDIHSYKSIEGNVTSIPNNLINDTFHTYYPNLYKSEILLDKVKCDNFLRQLDQLAKAVLINSSL